MTEQEFLNFKKQIEEEMTITSDNVLQKSLEVPKLHSKYLNYFSREFKVLKDLSVKKDEKYKEKYHYYRFNFNFDLKAKSEIDPYIYADPDFIKVQKEYDFQEIVVKYLEKTIDVVKNIPFSIKNHLDYKKFLSGN